MRNLHLLLSLLVCVTLGQVDPISTTQPKWRQVPNPHSKPAFYSSSIKAPYDTNSFFQNLVLEGGYGPINLLPYIVKVEEATSALGVGFPQRVIKSWSTVQTPYHFNWVLGIVEGGKFDSHSIIAFDQFSATVEFIKEGAGSMTTPLVRGSGFITATVNNLTPNLYTESGIVSVELPDGTLVFKKATSDRFIIQLACGGFWILYTSSPVDIDISRYTIRMQKVFTGTYRLAYIGKTPASASIYDKYKQNIPVAGDIGYNFLKQSKADVIFTYTVKDMTTGDDASSGALMFALPHHMDSLKSPTVDQSLTYETLKGVVTGVIDKVWTLQEDLPKARWQARKGVRNQEWRKVLSAALILDINYYSDPQRTLSTNGYSFGYQVNRLARQALIAKALGKNSFVTKAVEGVRRMLEPWLAGTAKNELVYDSTWGGIITSRSLYYKQADYGNGIYKQPLAQYGYMLYAIAVASNYDASFAKQYKDEILSLVRNIANPSTDDPYFPVTRCKDWFYGHSWGAGLESFFHNRYQESSSEALNAYYSVALIGNALKDKSLQVWGRLLMATEIRSAKKYFQIPDTSVYPPVFAGVRMVGVLWDTKVDSRSFVGTNQEYAHALQILPFTPVTEQLIDPAFARIQYPVIGHLHAYNEWLSYIIMTQAFVDKKAAWERFQLTKDIHHYGRNSKSNTLWWIATRP